MRILLIRPPAKFIEGAIKPSLSLPTGLLYLAAVLERAGQEVHIYDAQVNRSRPVLPGTDDSLHMGDSWQTVRTRIAEGQPNLVGISCMFSAQMENALYLAELVKQINPRIVTIIGGSHPTVRPKDFFEKTGAIDLVCMGEGEFTLREVVEKLNAGSTVSEIPGIALRDGETIRINPPRPRITPLDELSLPAYHLINLEDYFDLFARGYTDRPMLRMDGFERSVSIITSRGCPHQCIFCSVHLHMGRSWRAHSVDYVQRHIALLSRQYGVRHIHFEDDNVSLDAKRFLGILKTIQGVHPPLSWDTPNGLRVDTLTKEILELCRESGCVYLIFGVESGNQHVLDTIINKHLNLETVIRAASWAREIGVDAMAFYVIGFPGETVSQMNDTVHFALRLQARYGVTPHLFVATPIPGTRLERVCIERGFITDTLSSHDLARMTQGGVLMSTDTFSGDDVRTIMNSFFSGYRINIVKQGIRLILRKPHRILQYFRCVNALRKVFPLPVSVIRAVQLGRWIERHPQSPMRHTSNYRQLSTD